MNAAATHAVTTVVGLVERQSEGHLEAGDPVRAAFVLVSFLHGLAAMINAGSIGYDEATIVLRDGLTRLAFQRPVEKTSPK